MILNDRQMFDIQEFLKDMAGGRNAIKKSNAVIAVLEFGNTKQSSATVLSDEDLKHAIEHYRFSKSTHAYDNDDTRQHHNANAVGRCVLAIKKIMEEEWE